MNKMEGTFNDELNQYMVNRSTEDIENFDKLCA